MSSSRHHHARVLTALLVSTLVVGGWLPASSGAASPTVRYASPQGEGTSCTGTDPCSLQEALNFAPDDATVLITPGHYFTPADLGPGRSTGSGGSKNVVVTGVGSPAPTLRLPFSGLVMADGTLSNLRIEDSSGATALDVHNSTVDRVRVTSYESDACHVDNSTLANTVCAVHNGGSNSTLSGVMLNAQGNKVVSATLRNVTAVGGSLFGYGVYCFAATGSDCSIRLINSIAVGGQADVIANSFDQAGSATVTAQYSCLNRVVTTGSHSAVNRDSTDTTAQPRFVDQDSADFRIAKGSPTIDSGLDGGSQGTRDVAGVQRILGKAVDMGAYEYLPRPAAATPTVLHRGRHSVRLEVAVNTGGLKSQLVVSARRPNFTISDNPKRLAATRNRHDVQVTATGLARHTSYRLFVTVTDAGGSTRSKSVKVHTG